MEEKDGHEESGLSFGWPSLWKEQSPIFLHVAAGILGEALIELYLRSFLIILWNVGSQFYARFQTLKSITTSFLLKQQKTSNLTRWDPTKKASFEKLYQTQKDWGGGGEMKKNKQTQILVTDGDKSPGTIKSNLNTK